MVFSKLLGRLSGVLAILALFIGQPVSLQASPAADILLVNGKIFTPTGSASMAQALAIEDGRVAATGSDDEMRKLAGATTKIIDLGGRTVIPGLIDSHIHAIRAGFRYASEVHWDGLASLSEAIELLR